MKKILCFLLSLLVIFSLYACNNDAVVSSTESIESSSVVSVEESSKEVVSSKEEASSIEESHAETSSKVQTRGSVAITLENWDTYFEFAVIPRFSKNAFGDIDTLEFAHLLKLKDEYVKNFVCDKTSIAVEVSYIYGDRNCTVDLENQTYTLGEYKWYEKETEIEEYITYCGVHGFDVWGFQLGKYFYIGEVRDGSFCSYSDFELLRVQGTLYLK